MKTRLRKMLMTVKCEGPEEYGACPERRSGAACASIEKLELCQINAIAEHLWAEGALIPPVKIGDTVYAALCPFLPLDKPEVCAWEVDGIAYRSDGTWWCKEKNGEWRQIGDEYCKLTKEEAEAVLKGTSPTLQITESESTK